MLLALMMLATLTCSAFAQRGGGSGGGSGGGGNARHGGSFNLVYDHNGTVGGSRCSCIGGYNLTTYVTTLSIDYKLKNSDLPDGTLVYATVYSKDYYTGVSWLPMSGGAGSMLAGQISFHNPNVVTTGVFGLPVLQTVVLTLADGSVLFSGHP